MQEGKTKVYHGCYQHGSLRKAIFHGRTLGGHLYGLCMPILLLILPDLPSWLWAKAKAWGNQLILCIWNVDLTLCHPSVSSMISPTLDMIFKQPCKKEISNCASVWVAITVLQSFVAFAMKLPGQPAATERTDWTLLVIRKSLVVMQGSSVFTFF